MRHSCKLQAPALNVTSRLVGCVQLFRSPVAVAPSSQARAPQPSVPLGLLRAIRLIRGCQNTPPTSNSVKYVFAIHRPGILSRQPGSCWSSFIPGPHFKVRFPARCHKGVQRVRVHHHGRSVCMGLWSELQSVVVRPPSFTSEAMQVLCKPL
jgi:hypothetical protein